MFPNDTLAFLVSFTCVGIIIHICSKLRKKGFSLHVLRETTHILMGVWPLIWFLFETMIAAFLVTLIVTLFLVFAPRRLRDIYSSGDEKHFGLILYSTMFMIITYFFWMSPIGATAIFTLAFSDGAAGLIGKKYGKHKFCVPWGKEKSAEGSLVFLFVSMTAVSFAYVIFSDKIICFLLLVVYGFLTSVVEFLSPPHTDNVTVPIASILILIFLPPLICP